MVLFHKVGYRTHRSLMPSYLKRAHGDHDMALRLKVNLFVVSHKVSVVSHKVFVFFTPVGVVGK